MSETSTVEGNGVAVTEPGPAPRYESVSGLLVLVTEDERPVVEFDGPEGEARRRPALATVKVERSAVGRPVELMFVEGDLDQPVITKVAHVIDLQAELRMRWDALGRKVLGLDRGPRKLADLVQDLSVFVCVVAWFETHGNITHAAKSLGTSRRSLRHYINIWKEQHPCLVPAPPVRAYEINPRETKAKTRRPEVESHALEGGQ